MDTTRHAGKVAIVTGAGSGIGAAATMRLAAEGAVVIGVDVNAEGLERVRTQVEEQGDNATYVTLDVTDRPALAFSIAANSDASEAGGGPAGSR